MDEGIRPGLKPKDPSTKDLRAFGLGRPMALLPLYRVWMPAALFLGKANTFLLMFLFYYLIVTPYALILRLCGVEMLDLRFKDRDSYWLAKKPF